jgi:hypothetical protein
MKSVRRVPLVLLAALLVLQACDFLLTWQLLGGSRPEVYEANPLASATLERFGWGGLALFKSAVSVLVVLAALLVLRRRPALAGRLLGGLCLLMAGVVGYSGWLMLRPTDPLVQQMPRLVERNAELSQRLSDLGRFERRRRAICADVLHERIDLAAAVRRMRDCLDEEEPKLSTCVRINLPARDRADEVAGFLYYHASRLVDLGLAKPGQLKHLGQRLGQCYPTVTLLECWRKNNHDPFPWGQARRPVLVVLEDGRAG